VINDQEVDIFLLLFFFLNSRSSKYYIKLTHICVRFNIRITMKVFNLRISTLPIFYLSWVSLHATANTNPSS